MTAEQLRERVCDRAVWPCGRDLVFGNFPEIARLHGLRLGLARAIYQQLAPGCVLPEQPTTLSPCTYNLLPAPDDDEHEDRVYMTSRGDGILVAEHYWGVALEGVDNVYHVLVRDEIAVIFDEGSDYTASTMTFQLSTKPDTIDAATDVVLACATAAGLILLRRNDTPSRHHRRHHPH